MRKYKIYNLLRTAALLLTVFAVSCSADDTEDLREKDYGYVQFRLYKKDSYQTRAALDKLGDAGKIRVLMRYNGAELAQTLTLSASDLTADAAEWGLRSEKLQLLAGTYTVTGYTLYDLLDGVVDNGAAIPGNETFEVVAGGLTAYDFTADVEPRGYVKFRLVKDMSDFNGYESKTRAIEDRDRGYTFDEIRKVDISLLNVNLQGQTVDFKGLKTSFKLDFSEEKPGEGYRTSYSLCDTLLSIPAGQYRLYSYRVYDQYNGTLEFNTSPANTEFEIHDNGTQNVDVPILLNEQDEYIKDYYALRDIWEALDGPNWHYAGEDFPAGVSWNFNKDVDLWGDQPGVTLHSNGRVASVDVSNFGFRGAVPDAIGQLTELVSLYLGSHNDTNLLAYDPTTRPQQGKTLRQRHFEYAHMIHTPTQLSEPIARALRDNNKSIPEIGLYDKYSEDEIIDRRSGVQNRPQLYDVVWGRLCNGLTGISDKIANCKKLETFFIANSTITELPDVFDQLESLTDFELYNCPEMKEFPMTLAKLPNLVSANLSNNKQWDSDQIYNGLKALANGASKEKIQILYMRSNNLTELPTEDLRNMKKIGLLDLADNKLTGAIGPFGNEFAPVQLYLDNNQIDKLVSEDGMPFCNYADVETFSVTYNKLTEMPDIFNARSRYIMSSVDFSNNLISKIPEGYKGINVETLSLASNRFETFPKEILDCGSIIGSLNLRGNFIKEIPEKSFEGSHCYQISSIDLSYNRLTEIPDDFSGVTLPYLYGFDVSYNRFSSFPYAPLYCPYLTALAVRGQRDENGNRTLREWPSGVATHRGLRALYIGSNDLRTINDEISFLIYYLDISDNPRIKFDASSICYYYRMGAFILFYDKTQNITGCDIMLE